MSNTELKPCPFCGGKARIVLEEEDRPDDSFHNIYCTECGVQFWVDSKTEAIQKWNTRKPMERIVEQLETLESFHVQGYGDDHINLQDAIEIVQKGGAE